jgi:ribosomal protein S12 methylthiotransferase
VAFVSLGCPKTAVEAERILTQLRAEDYELAPSYREADLVVVNTCGFIDTAVEESLDTIGEALTENGRVIVTGCLGVREDIIRSAHPQVLAVTGPHALDEVSGDGAVARPSTDAPKIDDQVYIEEPGDMLAGELDRVQVVDTGEHDLCAGRGE